MVILVCGLVVERGSGGVFCVAKCWFVDGVVEIVGGVGV